MYSKILILNLLIVFVSSAASAGPANELIIPIVVNGLAEGSSHWRTEFTFLNLSDAILSGSMIIYDQNGNVQADVLSLFNLRTNEFH